MNRFQSSVQLQTIENAETLTANRTKSNHTKQKHTMKQIRNATPQEKCNAWERVKIVAEQRISSCMAKLNFEWRKIDGFQIFFFKFVLKLPSRLDAMFDFSKLSHETDAMQLIMATQLHLTDILNIVEADAATQKFKTRTNLFLYIS